jgi:hypothetical protein
VFFTAGDGEAQSVQAFPWRSWGFQEGDFSPLLCAVSSQKLLSCIIRDIQLDYFVAVHVFSLLLITLDAHRKKRKDSSSLCGERWYPLHNPCQSIPNPLCHWGLLLFLEPDNHSSISISSWAHGQLLYPDDLFLCSRSSKQPTIPASPQFTHKLSHKEQQQAITNVQGSPMR